MDTSEGMWAIDSDSGSRSAAETQDDAALGAATGSAGGGGLCGDGSCGACAGAIMVVSHLEIRPRDDFGDRAGATFRNSRPVHRLRQRFIQKHGRPEVVGKTARWTAGLITKACVTL